jgi:hypothetical protein
MEMDVNKVYQKIAQCVEAARNCERSGNTEWYNRHFDTCHQLTREYLPRGSGFDNGTSFDEYESTPDRLIFHTEFHHMNDNGYYDGWTKHDVIVTPNLAHGINVIVKGRDRNDIKDYIGTCFHESLNKENENA